jgi:hypothetical protein
MQHYYQHRIPWDMFGMRTSIFSIRSSKKQIGERHMASSQMGSAGGVRWGGVVAVWVARALGTAGALEMTFGCLDGVAGYDRRAPRVKKDERHIPTCNFPPPQPNANRFSKKRKIEKSRNREVEILIEVDFRFSISKIEKYNESSYFRKVDF